MAELTMMCKMLAHAIDLVLIVRIDDAVGECYRFSSLVQGGLCYGPPLWPLLPDNKQGISMNGTLSMGILILTFDQAEQRILERVLKRAGHSPHFAASAEELISHLRIRPPDLLLLDATLRGHGAQHLIREPALSDLPIGLLGARPVGGSLFHWVHHFLSRPARPRQIEAFIEQVMAQFHAPEAAQDSQPSLTHLPAAPPDTENSRLARVRDNLVDLLWPALTQKLSLRHPVLSSADASESVALGLREILDEQALLRLSRILQNIKPGVEVLRGDLGTISTPELLQLITMQRQTGIFEVASGEQKVELFFIKGALHQIFGSMPAPHCLLGRILLREGAIHPRDLSLFLHSHHQDPQRSPMGQRLIALGFLTPQLLQDALMTQSCEWMYELMSWQTGTFSFCRLPEHAVELRRVAHLDLKVEPLMMEGLRRLDEWTVIRKSIQPSTVFHPTMKRRDDTQLQPEESQIFALVDGRKDVRTIVEESFLAPFWVCKYLHQFYDAQLIAPS